MEHKKCSVCNIEKPMSDFPFLKSKNKYLSKCRQCKNEYERNYRSERREKFRKVNKIQYEKNKERRIEYSKTYRKEHLDSVNKKRMINYYKRMENDKLFKIKTRIRICIFHAFYRKNLKKNDDIEKILGCDLNYFYDYLLQTFKNNYGYEWNGVEKVHIDHIIPLATAKTEEDVINLCHYTNLQLLTAVDNLKKGSINVKLI